MKTVTFCPISQVEDSRLKYAVIAARYEGKWVFCRHRERATWEIPGGHREPGEDIIQTARRELWEETGALEAEITPVSAYGFDDYGVLFFAEIKKLGPLSDDFEIQEIALETTLPDKLTYPHIQPPLFHRVQGWLNEQSNAGELWDVYDENRCLTGRLHRRGEPLAPGEYHLVVYVWTENSKGEFLLTKRSLNKGYPGLWEATGGSALAGDDSLSAALREVREETGLFLRPENGRCVLTKKAGDHFYDVWHFRQEFDLDEVVLQEGETCGARCASRAEIMQMERDGQLVPYGYLEEFFEVCT